MKLVYTLIILLVVSSCKSEPAVSSSAASDQQDGRIIVGAERVGDYIEDITFKKVGLVVNHSSMIGHRHIVDVLLPLGIQVEKIFSPEHGFRGEADAGEKVADNIDPKTGIEVVSLYGDLKKPRKEDLKDIDILIFDIQDVGVRFYTYISTLHYVMEAAAENNIQVLVLDRPNPNGHYIDGPVLESAFSSFVGMHRVPVVYGMTIGEYAMMINGEGWLSDGIQCRLKVIPCLNYDHNTQYVLPIKPSPNLPNALSIAHYPSICFFEGTSVSVGRGTDHPFQVIGHPDFIDMNYEFTPISKSGAKYPKHQNKLCHGMDLKSKKPRPDKIDLSYLIYFYDTAKDLDLPFFNEGAFFDLLAGTDQLKKSIIEGKSEKEIRSSWMADLDQFKAVRSKYLLYD